MKIFRVLAIGRQIAEVARLLTVGTHIRRFLFVWMDIFKLSSADYVDFWSAYH